MAARKSGQTKVRLYWKEREQHWRASVSVNGDHRGILLIQPYKGFPFPVDGPTGYDEAARSAVALALDKCLISVREFKHESGNCERIKLKRVKDH